MVVDKYICINLYKKISPNTPETSTTGNNLKFCVNNILPAKPTAIALKIIAIKNVIVTLIHTPSFLQINREF